MTASAPLAVVAALVLTAGAAAANPPLRASALVADLERGLFCAPTEAGRMDAPDTAFGWIHVPEEPVDMRQPGTLAPAVLGLGFGVEYTLAGTAPVLIRHIVEHPAMPPAGTTRQSWESWALGGVPEVVFFQFDIEDELVPGRWTFTAMADEEEVYHAAFDVVPAAAAPHLAQLCEEGDLLTLNR